MGQTLDKMMGDRKHLKGIKIKAIALSKPPLPKPSGVN
jgi:hypothetical protein